MFSTFRNQPGVYRQLSLTPKYYYGDDKIVINLKDSTEVTQEDIFTGAVYQIETGASKVVIYYPLLNIEKEVPTKDVCSIIERYYEKPDRNVTIYHNKHLFVLTNLLHANVTIVEAAGNNYPALKYRHIDDEVDIDFYEKVCSDFDTVEDLLNFMNTFLIG